MSIYVILALAVVLFFVGWLLMSSTKKIKRPSFTEGKSRNSLSNINGMLDNITKKDDDVVEPKIEKDETTDKEEDIKVENVNVEKKHSSNKRKQEIFNLKSAVIGSNIINKKKS